MSTHPPPPRVNPKDLYAWASRELLDECSSLLSTRAVREHMGDPCSYDHRAFAKRHDDDMGAGVRGRTGQRRRPLLLRLPGGLQKHQRAPALLQV